MNGTTIHYVRGGGGPAVMMLHGFPQDWYAFRRIMPGLASNFTVVSMDMRGVRGSAVIAEGYDAATVAEDIRQLAAELDLGSIYFVGQDNGGIVAYTFARLYPQTTRGVMILDVPLPGIEPWEEVKAEPLLWHFGFHQTADLPEQLILGREFTYFRAFFDRFALRREAISDEDVAHYVRAYAGVERLRAGLEFYRRAYPGSETFNATTRSPLRVPIVLAGGDRSTGPANTTIAKALREHGCEDVTVEPVQDSGHWVVDEQPALVAALIERYAALSMPLSTPRHRRIMGAARMSDQAAAGATRESGPQNRLIWTARGARNGRGRMVRPPSVGCGARILCRRRPVERGERRFHP